MDLNEFRKLITAYGTVEANWPASTREAARTLIDTNPEAAALVVRHSPLDNALDRYDVPVNEARIRAGILARIDNMAPAKNVIDRFTSWLFPDLTDLHGIWRPALAASLPLILGIILGSTVSFGATDSTDTWSDEISMVALSTPDATTTAESLP